jgi:outer membrane protein assembly factor BamB
MSSGRARRRSVVALLALAAAVVAASGAATQPDDTFDGRNGIAVVDLATGQELWAARPSDDLVGYFAAAPGRRIVVASEGSCVDFLQARNLVAFDAATGRRRWSVPGDRFAFTTSHHLSTYFSTALPVDAGGVVVTTNDDATTAYRSANGTEVWSHPAAEDAAFAVTEELVLTHVQQAAPVTSFRALDRRTGRVRWESQGWDQRFDLVAADERHVVVAIGGVSSQPYEGPVTLVVLDAQTGAEQTRFDAGRPRLYYFNDVALTADLVVYADGSSIVGRKLTNGDDAWRRRFHGARSFEVTARSADDRTVFALGAGTGARVTALDSSTGRVRWSRSDVALRAAGASTAAFARTQPGRALVGLDVASGARRWRYAAPQDLTPAGLDATSLAIGAAGGHLVLSNGCDSG